MAKNNNKRFRFNYMFARHHVSYVYDVRMTALQNGHYKTSPPFVIVFFSINLIPSPSIKYALNIPIREISQIEKNVVFLSARTSFVYTLNHTMKLALSLCGK